MLTLFLFGIKHARQEFSQTLKMTNSPSEEKLLATISIMSQFSSINAKHVPCFSNILHCSKVLTFVSDKFLDRPENAHMDVFVANHVGCFGSFRFRHENLVLSLKGNSTKSYVNKQLFSYSS